jgi:hypothetical protein
MECEKVRIQQTRFYDFTEPDVKDFKEGLRKDERADSYEELTELCALELNPL